MSHEIFMIYQQKYLNIIMIILYLDTFVATLLSG